MMSKKYIKLAIFFLFAIIFCITVFLIIKNKELFSIEYIYENYQFLEEKIENNYIIYYIIFFLLYFFISLFALPLAGILCLLIGALFGFFPGIILASFASSLGALLCF